MATVIAAEGAIIIKESNGVAALLEVNCQTEIVAKDANFTAFAEKVAASALSTQPAVEQLQFHFEEDRVALVAEIGENINIRRVRYVRGTSLASYRHGRKIGVVVGGEGDTETLQHVAMQVAATCPEYVNPEDIPAAVVAKEKVIQVEMATNEDTAAKVVVRHIMKKFVGEIALTGQALIMEPEQSVGEMLQEKGASVSHFVRLEVGEGIEKAGASCSNSSLPGKTLLYGDDH